MRIKRLTYGRGFTEPVGPPGSFQSARAYREVTVELDDNDEFDEARKLLVDLVEADLGEDFTRATGKSD